MFLFDWWKGCSALVLWMCRYQVYIHIHDLKIPQQNRVGWTQVRHFFVKLPQTDPLSTVPVRHGVKNLQWDKSDYPKGLGGSTRAQENLRPNGLMLRRDGYGRFVPCRHYTKHDCWFKHVYLIIAIQSGWPVWGVVFSSWRTSDFNHPIGLRQISSLPSNGDT